MDRKKLVAFLVTFVVCALVAAMFYLAGCNDYILPALIAAPIVAWIYRRLCGQEVRQMEPELADMDNGKPKGIPVLLTTVGLFLVRVVVGIVVLPVIFVLITIFYLAIHCPFIVFVFLGFILMMIIFACIDYFTSKFTASFRKLPPLPRSVGCFSVVLILTLVLGVRPLASALGEQPFILPQKNATYFEHHDSVDNVTVGADLYLTERLEQNVFQNGRAFDTYPLGLVVVELIVFNDTENSIEISSSDLTLNYSIEKYNGQPIHVVGYETVQGYLTSFEMYVSEPDSLPQGFVVLSPLLLGQLLGEYLRYNHLREALSENKFDFGLIAPSETLHGFVYFEVVDYLDYPPYLNAFRSPRGWELDITIHHSTGNTSQYSFDW